MTTTDAAASKTAGAIHPEISGDGAFRRQGNWFTGRITADGSSGHLAEPGRYHLYVSLACPWAHRAIIVRKALGLEDVISMSVVDPIRDDAGWRFTEGDGHGPDPVKGFSYLSEAYAHSDPDFQGRVTVPCVWDRTTDAIVTNDYPDITVQFHEAFRQFSTTGVDLYPEELRSEIEAFSEPIYHDVNNGVYKTGFATTQTAYEAAFDALFQRLDLLDDHLADRRYLVGNRLTEADVRLFTTLVRFDAVYAIHFKCTWRRIADYPNLWPYARDLYQTDGFGDTTDFDHIRRHYYMTHPRVNPLRLVPKGPDIDWLAPHGREALS